MEIKDNNLGIPHEKQIKTSLRQKKLNLIEKLNHEWKDLTPNKLRPCLLRFASLRKDPYCKLGRMLAGRSGRPANILPPLFFDDTVIASSR